MKRRHFLHTTGLLTGGLLLQHNFAGAFNNEEEKIITVAIVGCGDRGKGIIHILNELPQLFKVVAICDVLDFRLTDAAAIVTTKNINSYKDHKKLLQQKDIDAVVIAVPLNGHYTIAADTLAAGKHLYLEKTMTYNIGQALQLVQLAKQHKNQTIQVGHQYRYSPLYYRVKEMIQSGYLGTISHVDCRWDRNGSWRRPVPEPGLERAINWRMYREYSGGLVAELLSHQIDFINWAFDTHPDEFLASGGIDIFKDGRETFDNVQVTMRYKKPGFTGSFGATCGNAKDGYLFKIKGTKGTVSLLMDQGIFYPEKKLTDNKQTVDGVTGATKIVWDKEGGTPILPEPTKDGTWYAFNEFYKAVTKNQLPDSNIYTGAKTAICVGLANEALYNESITHWKEEYNVS